MRLEEMKNNIPETPDFIHKMVQEEVSRQLQDTKVVPMKKRKWNKVQAAAAAALCLLATSTVAYAGNRLYHMYVEKQGTYRVETEKRTGSDQPADHTHTFKRDFRETEEFYQNPYRSGAAVMETEGRGKKRSSL